MFGTISLGAALFFALLAMLAYGMRGEYGARYGRTFVALSFLTTLAASVVLMAAIFQNRFDIG